MKRSRHKTAQAVAGTVRRHGLIDDGCRVVVATSGGPDSVALASILLELSGVRRPRSATSRHGARRGRFDLVLAHLNHGLRRTACRDETFVRELARRWALPLMVERADVAAEATRRGVGVEEAARTVRYEFLRQAAEQCGADRVALGHHGDDQAETVLMNFLRGSGLRGLAGMPIRRPLAPDSRIVAIRPLLEVTREQILDYLKARQLEWMDDETNRSPKMLRNRVRHELLPLLERDYAKGLRGRLGQLAEHLAAVQQLLAGRAAAVWDEAVASATPRAVEFHIDVLRDHGPAICGELVLAALEHLAAGRQSVTADHLEALWRTVRTESGGQRLELPDGIRVTRRGRILRIATGS
ncbi:MAG: tRNA lysidine(34) synthetase TilS [Planctomycetes bacterium]|nr:tRNA lysidine(34) synthetase TilS [Planctomycetota bacterium]